jgi:hypothetical protein
MFEVILEIYQQIKKVKKNHLPYDLCIITRKGFNDMWNPYFARILYFIRR